MTEDAIHVFGGAAGPVSCMQDLDLVAQRLNLAADRVAAAVAAAMAARQRIEQSEPGPQWHLWDVDYWARRFRIGPGLVALRNQMLAEVDALIGQGELGALVEEIDLLASRVRIAQANYDEVERQAQIKADSWVGVRAELMTLMGNLGPNGWLASVINLGLGLAQSTGRYALKNGRAPSLAELLRERHPEVRAVLGTVVLPPFVLATPSTTKVARGTTKILAMGFGDGLGTTINRGVSKQERAQAGVEEIALRLQALSNSRDQDSTKIMVSKVVATGGDISWLVLIPGTSDPTGFGDGPNPANMSANLRAVAGDTNAIGSATAAALRAAGAKKGEPVVLAGHSQGGIVSAQLATDKTFNSKVNVAGVLTFGSPVSEMTPPHGQQWLSIEHVQDAIPALSGTNQHGASHTTVARDLAVAADPALRQRAGDTMSAHSLTGYADTGRLIDQSNTASVKTWRNTVAPVLDKNAQVTSTEWVITGQGGA
ncbi:MAG: alpha/beta fold hydrolase [Bifidobacteriaceae bacterium]|jgi:pimeloyl-ACP methyl ester carboxylesterase|nr:alpha/beta fold hydrolase [Bifidobacteriaceae bacterium]